MSERCRFCGAEINEPHFDGWNQIFDCRYCGQYAFTREAEDVSFDPTCEEHFIHPQRLVCYLYHHKTDGVIQFIGTKNEYEAFQKEYSSRKTSSVTREKVEHWYPKTFAEKMDLILLKMSKLSKYEGNAFLVGPMRFNLFLCDTEDATARETQCNFTKKCMQENGYISVDQIFRISLTPKAYERIYELQKSQANNKNVFVAMSFRDENEYIYKGIQDGIQNAGYDDVFMKKVIHNRQIVPEMLRLIRDCRFLVMDITDPNYGAYYEAGYADALGKEVIITCSEERFYMRYETDEEKKYERYLKPHFDIAQKQVLVWKDQADLTQRLSEWIKVLI